MSTHADDPDGIIRRALAEDEAAFPWIEADPSTATLLTETFRGRNRILAVGGVIANILFFGVALYAIIGFLRADETQEMLRWGGTAALSVGLLLAVKVWYWLEMTRLSLTRDLKRLELRVTRLAERSEERDGEDL